MRGDIQSIDSIGATTEHQQGFVIVPPVRGAQAPFTQLLRRIAGNARVYHPLAFFVDRKCNPCARWADYRKALQIRRASHARFLSALQVADPYVLRSRLVGRNHKIAPIIYRGGGIKYENDPDFDRRAACPREDLFGSFPCSSRLSAFPMSARTSSRTTRLISR